MSRIKKIICVLIATILTVVIIPVSANAEEQEIFRLSEFSDYYGRSALEKLPNATALLYAYDNIAAGIEASLASISVYNGENYISEAELGIVIDAYVRDYAHHFWLGKAYTYSYNKYGVTKYTPQYTMAGATLEQAKAELYAAADEILALIDDSMTDYEKELVIHDALVQRIVYLDGTTHAHDAYGALVEGYAVCEGYAEAFQYLLHRAGIQSFLVIGSSRGEGHEWNVALIDGEYYHVDPTWNDQGDTIFHAYFNTSDAVIEEDHYIDPTVYAMPVCDTMDAHYFTVSGSSFADGEYTTDKVAEILKKSMPSAHFYIKGNVNAFVQWYYDNIVEIADKVGVVGQFSYGYSALGREVILVLNGEVPEYEFVLESGSCTTDDVADILRKYHPEAVVYVKGDVGSFIQWYYDNIIEIAEKAGVVGGFSYGYAQRGREITLVLDGEYVELPTEPEPEYVLGDVDGDGYVTNSDVLMIFRYIYNPELYPLDVTVGDVDRDGEVTNSDVLMIFRYIYNSELYPLG